MGRPRLRATGKTADRRHRRPKASIRSEPRQPARAGQGGHVQRLRVGQLLPRRGHQPSAAAKSAAAPSSPMRRSWCAPDSPVYTPQQLAGRTVGVPFYAGTHYLALHMLEGFLPRDQIKVCSAPNGSRNRFDSMMKGEIEATTLTEPYMTLRREEGLPRHLLGVLSTAPRSRRTGSTPRPMRAFNRAVREAVRRINANKRALPPLLHRLSQGEGPGDRRA